jgi:hypothetical protein
VSQSALTSTLLLAFPASLQRGAVHCYLFLMAYKVVWFSLCVWQLSLRVDLARSDADKAALRGDVERAAGTIAGLEHDRVCVHSGVFVSVVPMQATPHVLLLSCWGSAWHGFP